MEKVVLTKKDVTNEIFEYNDVNVELIPFISTELELSLIKLYLEKYFTPNQEETLNYLKNNYFDYWLAEYSIKRAILDELTSVDVYETNADTIIDIFMEVSARINNYDQFKYRLYAMVNAVKDSKSVGNIIDNLSNKLNDILSNLQNLDVDKLTNTGKDLLKQIEDSPVKEIFTEAQQEKTNKKRVKKEVK